MKVMLKNWKKDDKSRLYIKLLGANDGYDVDLGYFDRTSNQFNSEVNFETAAIVEMIINAIVKFFGKESFEKSLNCNDAKSYVGNVSIELTAEEFLKIKNA